MNSVKRLEGSLHTQSKAAPLNPANPNATMAETGIAQNAQTLRAGPPSAHGKRFFSDFSPAAVQLASLSAELCSFANANSCDYCLINIEVRQRLLCTKSEESFANGFVKAKAARLMADASHSHAYKRQKSESVLLTHNSRVPTSISLSLSFCSFA